MPISREITGENSVLHMRNGDPLNGLSPSSNAKVSATDQNIDGEKSERRFVVARAASLVEDAGSPQDMTTFSEWAGSILAEQRRDINCISRAVSRIEEGLGFFKENIDEIRIGSLSAEVGSTLPTDSKNQKPTDEDMDAIASAISKLNQKVNDVDTLRLELQLLKSRLKRVEDGSRGTPPSADSYLWSTLPRKRKVQPCALDQEDQGLPVIDPRKPDGNVKQFQPPTTRLLGDPNNPTTDTMSVECNDEAVYQTRRCARLAEEQESSSRSLHVLEREQKTLTGPLSSPSSSPEPHVISTCGSPGPSTKKTKSSRRIRRAYPQGLRNADGVRLTKSGTPDKRAGNYKYLKAYYDRLKGERDAGREQEQEQEQGQESGGKKVIESSEYGVEFEGSWGEEEGRTVRSTNCDRERDGEISRSELEASARLARERMETLLKPFADISASH